MCGIAGIYFSNGGIAGCEIQNVTNALRHRGPDDEGYILYAPNDKKLSIFYGKDTVTKTGNNISEMKPSKKGLMLGHRRLAIIDPSPAGHQPMVYDDDNIVIVFNGEIYNYIEIREKLMSKGYRFKTQSDTEVILASYKEHGIECLDNFNGMWSFVILDIKRNLLFGARDRFGVKPFYYFKDKNIFAFASEIKALLELQLVKSKSKLNEGILYDYLMWGVSEHKEETFITPIVKLPQSHYFIYDMLKDQLSIKRYYKLDYNRTLGVFDQDEYRTYCRNIKKQLFEAISIRLRSDVPVGSCLSGGIDSSSIVVIINEIMKNKNISNIGTFQKVFTACYNDHKIDERKYASEIVNKTKSEWYQTFPDAAGLLQDFEKLIYSQDEPFVSTSLYAQYKVIQSAKESGIKVLLDGQGGDELFSGYKHYYNAFYLDLIKNYRFKNTINEIKYLKNSPINLQELIMGISKFVGIELAPLNFITLLKHTITPEYSYINKDFVKTYSRRDETAKDIACFSINDMSYKLMNDQLQSLLRYEDRNSMAHGVESRTPFSDDKKLIEYVFSIPSVYKIHNGWNKFLLRESLNDLLPDMIRYRTDKIGFETPQNMWLKQLSKYLKQKMDDNIPYINTQKIIGDFDKLLQHPSSSSTLWRFINYSLWKNIFQIN